MNKTCHGCDKQIPEAAQHCVFCGVAQPEGDPTIESRPTVETAPISIGVTPTPEPLSSRAHVTMLGIRVDDVEKLANEGTPVVSSMPLDPTPVRGLPIVEDSRPTPDQGVEPIPVVGQRSPSSLAAPLSGTTRAVMASGGLVLVVLFTLPWHGVTSWQLLDTLAGADFVRQLYYLLGGTVLLALALLPVPMWFRAALGVGVASIPLVLGAEGPLSGWRGFVAALAVVGLAAALLCTRPRRAMNDPARMLVAVAILGLVSLYVVPVSSVMPISYLGHMLVSGQVGDTVVAVFLAIPLLLAALSLLGALGRDLTSAAVLLAVLVLLWAPGAVMLFVDDGTQLYTALALLWTSATAALSAAQLVLLAQKSA